MTDDILAQLKETARDLREQADGGGLGDLERLRLRSQADGITVARHIIARAPRSTDHDALPDRGTVIDFAGIHRDDVLAFDYPLTGVCSRCGRPVRLGGPREQWAHMTAANAS